MKTTTQIIGWLKANNYWDAMERNYNEYGKSLQQHRMDLEEFIEGIILLDPDEEPIFNSFIFNETPEGFDYWCKVRRQYNEWRCRELSQNEDILYYLMTGKTLTSLEALGTFGCLRLGARIADLRNRGYAIETRMITLDNGKRVAEYKLYE